MRLRRFVVFVGLVASVALLLPVAAPASADTGVSDAFTAQFTATLSPGLPATGCAAQKSSIDFSPFVITGDDGNRTGSVFFDGSSPVCESLTMGEGSGALSGLVSGNVSYQRFGSTLMFSGRVDDDLVINWTCSWASTGSNGAGQCQGTLSSPDGN